MRLNFSPAFLTVTEEVASVTLYIEGRVVPTLICAKGRVSVMSLVPESSFLERKDTPENASISSAFAGHVVGNVAPFLRSLSPVANPQLFSR